MAVYEANIKERDIFRLQKSPKTASLSHFCLIFVLRLSYFCPIRNSVLESAAESYLIRV